MQVLLALAYHRAHALIHLHPSNISLHSMIFSPLRISCLTILALLGVYGLLVLLLTLRLWGEPEQDTTSGVLICWDEVAAGAKNSWSVNSVGGACLGAGWQVQIEQAAGVNGFTAGASVSCAAGVVAVTHTTLDAQGNLWPRLSILSVTGHVIADGELAAQVKSPHYAAEWTGLHALTSPWIIVGQNIWNSSADGLADISLLAMYSAQDAEIGDIFDLSNEPPVLVDHILALGGAGDSVVFLACGDVQCALICLDATFSEGERSPKLVQRWVTLPSDVPALTDHVSISCLEHVVLVSWRAGTRGCQLAFGAAAGAPLWDTCSDANASVPLSASAIVSMPTWAAVALEAKQNTTTNDTMVALHARSLRDGSILWATAPIMNVPMQPNPYFLSVGTGVAVICRSLRETALLPQEGEFISAGVSLDTANVLWGDTHSPHGGFIGCAAQPVASADIAIFPLVQSHDFMPYPGRALGAALTTDVYMTAREVRSGRTTGSRVLQRVNLPDPAILEDRGQLLSGLAMVMPDQSSAMVIAQQQREDGTGQLLAQSLDCSTDDLGSEILNLSGAFMLLIFFTSIFVARLIAGAAWACCFWVRDFRGVKTAVLSSPPMYKEIRALPVRKLLQYMCMDRYMQSTHRSDSGNDFGDTTVYRPMLAGDLRTFSDADSSDGPSDLEGSASHPDLASQAAAAFRSRTSSQAGVEELWQQEADKLRLHAHQSLVSAGSPKLGGARGSSTAIGAPNSAWLASLPRVKPRRTQQELFMERARECITRCAAGTASAARAPFRWVAQRSIGCHTQAWEAGQYGQAGYPWLWLHAWHVVLGVVIVAAAMGGVGTEVQQFSSMLSDPAHFYNTYLVAAWDPVSTAKVNCAIPSVAACLCAGDRPSSQTCPDRGYWPPAIENCDKPCDELLPVMGVCPAAAFQYTCSCAPIPSMHINSSTPVTDDLVNALASCSDRYVTIWNSLKLVAIIYVAVVLSVQAIIVWNRCLPVSSLCGRFVKRHDSLMAAMVGGQAQVASVMWPSYAALGLLGGGLLVLVCVLLNSGELCTEAASPLSPEATTNTAALRPTSSLLLSHLPGCALNALWYNEAKEAAVLKAAWSATVSILIVVLLSVLDCAAMGCHLLVYSKNLQALAKAKYDEQQRVRDERSILPGARVSEKVTAPFSQLSIRTTYVWPGQVLRWRACCSNALTDAEIESSFSGQGSALLPVPGEEFGASAQPRNVGVLFSMPTFGKRAYIGGVLHWGMPVADTSR